MIVYIMPVFLPTFHHPSLLDRPVIIIVLDRPCHHEGVRRSRCLRCVKMIIPGPGAPIHIHFNLIFLIIQQHSGNFERFFCHFRHFLAPYSRKQFGAKNDNHSELLGPPVSLQSNFSLTIRHHQGVDFFGHFGYLCPPPWETIWGLK